MKNFKELKIWQKGMQIAAEVYHLTKQFPEEEKFGLVSQMRRCAVSIPSNIAEGSSRYTSKAQRNYLDIALGSVFELETQVMLCQMIGYITENDTKELLGNLREEQKMIVSFLKILAS